MKKQIITLLAASALCGAHSASAAMVITNLGGNTVNAGPAGWSPVVSNVLPAYEARTNWVYSTNASDSSNYQYAQTWKAPSNFDLTSYAIQMSSLGHAIRNADSQEVRLTVYSYASATANTPTSTLFSETGITPANFSGGADESFNWISFTLSTSVALTGGDHYGIFLEFTTPDATRTLSVNYSSVTNTYPDGIMIRNQWDSATPTWNNYGSGDMAFAVAAVPEPATWALLFGAVTALLIFRPRKRA